MQSHEDLIQFNYFICMPPVETNNKMDQNLI